MSLYCIGDVQGCDAALGRLLDEIGFSPSRDTIFVLGDLVNRGPDSRGVLHRLIGYGASARCLLGNHDLHLLAVAHGARKRRRSETIADILDAPDREPLLDWLRQQDMAFFEQGVLMVHAGVLPGWTAAQTLALAGEVEAVLRGPDIAGFLHKMYGDEPAEWDDGLNGKARLRVIVNALTRCVFARPKASWSSQPRRARAARRRVSCPGLTCPAGAPPMSRWPLATGRRWAGWTGPT